MYIYIHIYLGLSRLTKKWFIFIFHSRNVLTGSYNNYFHIYDREGLSDIALQADKSAFKAKRVGSAKNKSMLSRGKTNNRKEEINVDAIDFNKKILHASWHPNENSIAVAATNNLFIFTYVWTLLFVFVCH